MATTPSRLPVVLIAGARESALGSELGDGRYAIAHARTGALAAEWARDLQPDAIILDAVLPDMSAMEACGLLRGDMRIGPSIPILILSAEEPSPDQRVAALHAGAWDFLPLSAGAEALALQVHAYVQAKRNVDVALAGDVLDRASGVHSRLGLVRRARELGALMTRSHGSLACVVFDLDAAPADKATAGLVARNTRTSDVVGMLDPTTFTVLAPGTDHNGAVRIAQRIGNALRDAADGKSAIAAALRVGYDAVANLKYAPMDAVELLSRARAAVRLGSQDPGCAWLRRFDGAPAPPAPAAEPAALPGLAPRPSPTGLVLEDGAGGKERT